MLTVFKRSVARSPEELTSPHSHADVRKNGMDLLDSFVSTNSGAVFLKLGDAGAMAYTHNKQALLKPRQIIFPCFCGLFLDLDDIFCVFEGSLENIAVLRQQYGLNKSANEVTIIIEAFRTLRDRGPYPADQVVRDLSGKFAFVLFDATSQIIFTAARKRLKCLPRVYTRVSCRYEFFVSLADSITIVCKKPAPVVHSQIRSMKAVRQSSRKFPLPIFLAIADFCM
eukprot:Gb_13788 [translate_table: standard]